MNRIIILALCLALSACYSAGFVPFASAVPQGYWYGPPPIAPTYYAPRHTTCMPIGGGMISCTEN